MGKTNNSKKPAYKEEDAAAVLQKTNSGASAQSSKEEAKGQPKKGQEQQIPLAAEKQANDCTCGAGGMMGQRQVTDLTLS